MLKGKQRSYLRSLGNKIDAIIQIGKNGVDDAVLNQISDALKARELIKVTVLKNSLLDPYETCGYICGKLNAEPVQVIGNRFLIYKRNEENPTIAIPR
ncbi:RNA-binding protein [Caloramator mitchellensis]|uniref:RNA-binding protein n=1 Tax=Caloramator mitchellensis TaxID=908809 RepID=A0A0R3K0T9_CALMK|nr:YhbY family RNA-binding protein [Caloramator mitchellensis]KRQ88157.1 RNA-binding protein [Caloramator mitchellensis]